MRRTAISQSRAWKRAGIAPLFALVPVLALGLAAATGARGAEGTAPYGPCFLKAEPRGGNLLVLGEKRGTIARIDPSSGKVLREATLGELPFALALHPDGNRVFVTCRRSEELLELDADSFDVLRRLPLRGEPTGVTVSEDGARLFVGVHSFDQVAVIDLETFSVARRLSAGNRPQLMDSAPGDPRLYVTNLLSNKVPVGKSVRNEVTVIDESTGRIIERIVLPNANIGRGVAVSSDGSFAVAAISRPKNLIPMAQVARGWVVTNGFVFLSRSEPPLQLLVDLPNRSFSDPHGIALTPDDKKFYLTAGGADRVLVVDVTKVREVSREIREGKIPRPSDHMGLSRRYVTARVAVGANPQAVEVSADGKEVYVANRLGDSISVIDTSTDTVVRTLALNGSPEALAAANLGERIFHNAEKTFQRQFACVSCHPDGGVDGLQYDLEPDGLGQNIVDNRSLRAIRETAPFKWVGTNPDIATQCGTRTAKWIVRTGWLNSIEVVALADYIHSIPAPRNPYRSEDGRLTPAQRRGKELFERTQTNSGEPIAKRDQCHFCHSGPDFTNFERFDVGTTAATDVGKPKPDGTMGPIEFDTAHLTNVYDSAPYLHDGRAATLEEIWTVYNPDDLHGISSDWNKQQLNDLIEYLKVLESPRETSP